MIFWGDVFYFGLLLFLGSAIGSLFFIARPSAISATALASLPHYVPATVAQGAKTANAASGHTELTKLLRAQELDLEQLVEQRIVEIMSVGEAKNRLQLPNDQTGRQEILRAMVEVSPFSFLVRDRAPWGRAGEWLVTLPYHEEQAVWDANAKLIALRAQVQAMSK